MRTLFLGCRGEDVKELQSRLNLVADGVFGQITKEAVEVFQRSKGMKADGIVGQATWNAFGMSAPNKRAISEIIIHCSATPEGKDFNVAQIRACHLQRGFNDIGYHYVIYRDGSILTGRSETVIGAHCTGHNVNSIGICYIGGVASDGKTPKDTRTPAQKEGLLRLIKEMKSKYPNARVYSHRDFANKACPSFDATAEYKTL